MPVKGFLTKEQVKELRKELKESELAYVRERILILLLQNDGKTQQEIANFLGCSLRKVAYWCSHGDPDNLESLHNKRESESYRKATKEYVELLLNIIEKAPQELGYEFGKWTGERLALYLEVQTGIRLSGSQVRRILKRKKYSYISAKYSLEEHQDAEKRKEFQGKIANYLKISKTEASKLQIWFWDESGFGLQVIRRKNWSKKGKRRKVSGKRRRGRVNVMGGIRESDRKRICLFVKKGNGDTFYEQLCQLYKFVLIEWVEQGNREEDFQQHGPKIVLVLDNASYHKRLDIKEKIAQNLPNIVLEFLPAYSPDYNLIELVWHSCKEYIANRLFTSVDELKILLDKLLNEGELVIKWHRSIKNKGNFYCAT